MDEQISLSVVIPCYNSSKSIEIVCGKLIQVLESRPEYSFEIILVNDGSPDGTWQVIQKLALSDPRITAINFSRNFGQHSAMMAAYRETRGELVIGMDDDGEHDPEDIFLLVDKINEGYDYVCSHYEENRSLFRSFGTRMNNLMAEKLIDKPEEIIFTSYYCMRRFVVDEIIRYEQPFPYIAGLLLRATRNLAMVPMKRGERISGHSGYTLRKMLNLWVNGFTAFSVKPLRIATGLGAIVAVAGFIMALVLIVKKLFVQNFVAGYVSTIATLTILCGLIMIILGMIGEYVGRIYISISMAPQYVIREKVCLRDKEHTAAKK